MLAMRRAADCYNQKLNFGRCAVASEPVQDPNSGTLHGHELRGRMGEDGHVLVDHKMSIQRCAGENKDRWAGCSDLGSH